jgi:hypothetical protein
MSAVYTLLGLYLVAVVGFAGRRLAVTSASGPILPTLAIFGFWNSVVAITASLAANYGVRLIAAGDGAVTTLSIIALGPLVLVLGGNIAICMGAYRAGIERGIVLLLASWIVASLLTIMALGAISPLTVLLNLLFQ